VFYQGGIMMNKYIAIFCVVISVAGCYEEPVPASKTVPPEARVYLQDKKIKDLSSYASLFAAVDVIDYVNLDRNEIEIFPRELLNLKSLKWLRLNSNKLSSLPDLSGLKNLRRIYLKANRFSSVPETLKDLPQLTDIDLSWNPIKEIPKWLAEKKGLKALSFTGTLITKLPDDISAWKSLNQLQLADLKLSKDEMQRIRKSLPDTAIVY
jgi:hypothetical protein